MTEKIRRKTNPFASARNYLKVKNSPVLSFESSSEFARLRGAFEHEIDPQGPVELMYTGDLVAIIWEILRWRRYKQQLLERRYNDLLYAEIKKACTTYGDPVPGPLGFMSPKEIVDQEKFDRIWELTEGWPLDKAARAEITKLLDGYEIDESNIETEVICNPPQSFRALDDTIVTLELRRDKTLRCIAEYRFSLALRMKKAAGSILEDERADLPVLEHKTDKSSEA